MKTRKMQQLCNYLKITKRTQQKDASEKVSRNRGRFPYLHFDKYDGAVLQFIKHVPEYM